MKWIRSQIKKCRQAFYQAEVQARQMGSFASNPVAFSWRFARQWGTNWLNAPDEKKNPALRLPETSENGRSSAAETAALTGDVSSVSSVLEDRVLAVGNRQYVLTTENLATVEGQEIYGGYGTETDGETIRFPVAIEKMARDRFEKPDRVFSKFSASNSLRESEYRLALKFRIVLPKAFVELSDDAQSVYLVYDLNNTQIDPQKMTTLSRVLRPFTPVEIDSILKDIWQSLDYLHNRLRYGEDLPVAHGNLSLDTLLFSEDEKVYLWQLGL
ncbi:hypothetical protein [Baaleninema sp.]|uniref:hypothetical protein n=1 Tax=Baaleninema sp. TaxID=3101197 RepID=UPI003CFE7AA6